MSPETYRALRESLGDRKKAARTLACSPITLRLRESGRHPISADAEARLREAVHWASLPQEAKVLELRQRMIEDREAARRMTPAEFQGCLDALGWTRREAARALLPEPHEEWRISAWALGRSMVPERVAQHLRVFLDLAPGAAFPKPTSAPGHRRRHHNPSCLPRHFRYALHLLRLTQQQAAVALGAANRQLVSDWACGRRPVPRYIERHLRTLLGVGPTDPWPQREISLVLPNWIPE